MINIKTKNKKTKKKNKKNKKNKKKNITINIKFLHHRT
jgi:hypothetical protein